MKPMIDIHSHMLPAVDDGCRSRAEALEMLRMYEEQGAEAVICTPHFGPCGIPGADVEGAFRWLSAQPATVKLYLGNEVLAGSFDPDKDLGKPGGPRYLAGTETLLLEFDEWEGHHTDTEYILSTVERMLPRVKELIVAHPERYRILRQELPVYERLVSMGAKLQINAYDIDDTKTEETKAVTQWLLENRLVSYLGSDAHGASKRPPMLKNGVQWIYDHCPEDYADAVVHDNAAALLLNR